MVVAIRDAESRTRFLGYRVEYYKLLIFTLSAAMAGVAGALYVPQVGIINPSEFAPANSIEAVIWVAVGGRGTLVGAALGAVLVNFGKTYFTGAFPEYWLFGLGGLFVLVTLFLPKGILGLIDQVCAQAPEAARRAADRARRADPRHAGASLMANDRSPHQLAPLPQRREGLVRRLQGAARPLAWFSAPARCAPSSARTAPARPR